MKIENPMLAASYDPTKASYPYLATPKIDGIRFIMVDGVALSRTFKPIRNKHIQGLLSAHLPDGVDGELTCGDSFQTSTSGIMSIKGTPKFKAWIFDYVPASEQDIPHYTDRMVALQAWFVSAQLPFECVALTDGQSVGSDEQVQTMASAYVSEGYEGAMLRSPNGTYKFGRATVKENILLKVKAFQDAEATVIAFVEKLHNANEQERDAFNHAKRSQKKSGMHNTGTLGALLVKRADGETFKIGSGLNDELRAKIWKNKSAYMDATVKYKFFEVGVKDKPRHPIFLGFRHVEDM